MFLSLVRAGCGFEGRAGQSCVPIKQICAVCSLLYELWLTLTNKTNHLGNSFIFNKLVHWLQGTHRILAVVAGEENSRGSLIDLVARFSIRVVDHDNPIIKCEVLIGYPCKGAWERLNVEKKNNNTTPTSTEKEINSPAILCVWPST